MVRALLVKTPKLGKTPGYVRVDLEPLGLLYIAAFVAKYSDHEISILDAQSDSSSVFPSGDGLKMGMSDETIRARLQAAAPQVVGISALFQVHEAEVINIARMAKALFPEVPVVIGGLDAGVRYAEYLKSGVIDLVVRGDGEEPFLEVLNRVERGERLTGIPGTCEQLASGQIRQNPEWVRRVPFDEYPFPARDLVPRRFYENRKTQQASCPIGFRHPALLMQSSRGCTLKCAFCDIVAVQDKWNAHAPEYVVDEIEHCATRYGTKEVVFVDDNFMLDPKRVVRICELIVKRKLKVALEVMPGVSVWTLNPSVIDTMVAAGLYRVTLPIETGNPKTLRFIKKPVNFDKVRASIDYCNRKGLYTAANMIIGFPFETREDIQQTFDFADISGLDAVNFYVAEPFEGARMYGIYKDNGWLNGDNGRKSWRTAHFTSEELEKMASEASRDYLKRKLRFYLNPKNWRAYLWPKLSSPAKIRYALGLARMLMSSVPRLNHDEALPGLWTSHPDSGQASSPAPPGRGGLLELTPPRREPVPLALAEKEQDRG